MSRRGLIAACALGLARPAAGPAGQPLAPGSAGAPSAGSATGPHDAAGGAGAVSADPVSMLIVNAGDQADRLLGASSPIAGRVEARRAEGYGASQRDVPLPRGIEIPAGSMVVLEPLGAHLALLDLRQPLVQGETFPLLLEFEVAGRLAVTGRVRRKLDAAGVAPIPPASVGGLSVSLVSARPAPGPHAGAPTATPAAS
ncbi:MAG: copper chaperone PCu(A)C [Chloroflexota bacterium]